MPPADTLWPVQSNEHETDDKAVQVTVLLVVEDNMCRWMLECLQGDTKL